MLKKIFKKIFWGDFGKQNAWYVIAVFSLSLVYAIGCLIVTTVPGFKPLIDSFWIGYYITTAISFLSIYYHGANNKRFPLYVTFILATWTTILVHVIEVTNENIVLLVANLMMVAFVVGILLYVTKDIYLANRKERKEFEPIKRVDLFPYYEFLIILLVSLRIIILAVAPYPFNIKSINDHHFLFSWILLGIFGVLALIGGELIKSGSSLKGLPTAFSGTFIAMFTYQFAFRYVTADNYISFFSFIPEYILVIYFSYRLYLIIKKNK